MNAAMIALTLLALALSLAPWPMAPVLGALLALILVLALEPRAIRHALRVRAMVLVVVAAGMTAAAVAWTSAPARGVVAGGSTFLRLVTLILVTTAVARRLDAESLQRTAARLGLARLGLVFGLALNSLPHLAQAWRDAWIARAIRSRRRHPRLRDLPNLVEVLLAHTARIADEAAVAAAFRGHHALGRPLWGRVNVPPIIAVVGRSGTGKTPLLLRSAERFRASGWPLFGFVQPAVTEQGQKMGFRVLDVRTGVDAPLAHRVGPECGQYGTPFAFAREGFALARAALESGPHNAILVVDELGPVELRGGGHWPAVRRAIRRLAPAVVLVGLRRQLLAPFLAELGADAVTVVDVEASDAAEKEVFAAVAAALTRNDKDQAGSSRALVTPPGTTGSHRAAEQ